jgi:hypothetical protein
VLVEECFFLEFEEERCVVDQSMASTQSPAPFRENLFSTLKLAAHRNNYQSNLLFLCLFFSDLSRGLGRFHARNPSQSRGEKNAKHVW